MGLRRTGEAVCWEKDKIKAQGTGLKEISNLKFEVIYPYAPCHALFANYFSRRLMPGRVRVTK